jgi:formylglycine-generating enzyme required for sulfatase activity
MWWCNDSGSTTHQVGLKQPNPYGLYDMHGNVWEWVADRYTSSLGTAAVTDPTGPSTGSNRVIRGGSWNGNARSCRSAGRLSFSPSSTNGTIGFRLARSP